MKRQRLSPQTWVETGLAALVSNGPSALAAEPLARKLGTTKGSFYWHFKDVPDFHAAVAKHWQSMAFGHVIEALKEDDSAEKRLRRFGAQILENRDDAAMRAWACTDESIAQTVAQVDAERLKYLVLLLRGLGLNNDAFARSCLGALIGLPAVSDRKQARAAFDTMVDVVLALR